MFQITDGIPFKSVGPAVQTITDSETEYGSLKSEVKPPRLYHSHDSTILTTTLECPHPPPAHNLLTNSTPTTAPTHPALPPPDRQVKLSISVFDALIPRMSSLMTSTAR